LGFDIRKESNGGGSVINSEMINIMSNIGMEIYLSEYPETKKLDGSGGAELRVIPIQYVKEGYQFPHKLKLDVDYDWNNQKIVFKVKNKDRLTDPSVLELIFENENKKMLMVREKVGVYSFKIPRKYLIHDNPKFTFRVKKKYFRDGNRKWFEISYIVR
jgi:hypothetical protein